MKPNARPLAILNVSGIASIVRKPGMATSGSFQSISPIAVIIRLPTTMSAGAVAAAGIAQVPEGRRLFPYMTVKENLLLGAYPGKAWKAKQKRMEWVMELFPILKERANMPSRSLSGGEQQMLTIGRGLMAQPQLLMVDEPSLGLAPVVQDNLYETLGKLRQSKITILLPEQNALRALGIADRGYVMQDGRIVLEGNAASLMQSDLVKKAYLGR